MIKIAKSHICCLFVVAFFLSACAKIHFIELEPIYIKANSKNAHVYRESYPKLIDIVHTKLDISFNLDSELVYGNAQITAKPYFYATDSMVLDAKGFDLHAVQLVSGKETTKLKYVYANNKLKIWLGKTYTNKEEFTIAINYTAKPQELKVGKDINSTDDRGLYFVNPKGKGRLPQQIWTQGETENNSCWFPTIENPAEKMTQEINISVANKFKTLSNGSLVNEKLNGDGTRTDSWEMTQPHSVYLTMLAVGDFNITKDHWKDIPVNYYTEPAFANAAKAVFGNTPEMIGFFSECLNYPYPWPKYDQMVVRKFMSGAMENTTATVLYDGLNITEAQHADNSQDDIIAHELFHHWFGDLVTAESWSNLPLNESFATYGEYLWREHKYGEGDANYHLAQDAKSYFSAASNAEKNLIRFNYADKEQMFDDVSYQKGGLVLHALRKEVGDDAFFKALHLYLTKNAYKAVEIHQLRLAFEEITGEDLNWFFNQWFLASGNPELKIEKKYDDLKHQFVIKVMQTQDTSKMPVYRLPLIFSVYDGEELVEKKIYLNQKEQEFAFSEKKEAEIFVTSPNLLVKITEEEKSEKAFYLDFEKSNDYETRYKAARYFNANKQNKYAKLVLNNALSDKEWPITYLGLLNFKSENASPENFDVLTNLATKNFKSLIRAEAVKVLKKFYPKRATRPIFEQLKTDKSILVKRALK